MPVYYNPGQGFTKISSFSSSTQTTEDYHGCAQGDYWQAAAGTCVSAASAGIIYYVGTEASGFGHYIVIEHEIKVTKQKVYTIYAHFNAKPTLIKGNQVQRGDIVGYVGNSGKTQNTQSKDMFFHFEIRLNNYWLADSKHKNALVEKGLIPNPATFDLSTLEGFTEEIEKTESTCTACLFKAITATKLESEQVSEPEVTASQANPISEPEKPTTQPVSQIGGEHPCASGKLVIQVTGHQHIQEKQKIYFYQEDFKTPLYEEADEITIKRALSYPQPGIGTIDYPSTLFNWDKCKVEQSKLGLKIKKTTGGYIYLPVADHITANIQTDKKEQYKSNHFLSFIPLTVMDIERTDASYLTHPNNQPNESNNPYYANMPTTSADAIYAPAREGYLYIFFNKKLWRELKIEQDDMGKNAYKDIDVRAYRTQNGSGVFLTEENLKGQSKDTLIRQVEGEALDNIWLPFRLSDQATKIQITYSEDQLSPERLNLIESTLINKLTALDTKNRITFIKTLVKANNFSKETQPFRIDYLPATRARNPAIEWKMYHPASYLIDITDQTITKKYKSTKEIDQLCANKEAPDYNAIVSDFNNIQVGEFREFEISAWQEILAEQTQSPDILKETIWKNHKPIPTQDVLGDYKTRYITGIPVIDPLNELHRHHMLLNIAQNSELFKCLAARTKTADKNEIGHFITNASQVHQDLRKAIKKLPNQVRHNYNRSIANAERSYLLNCIEQWQNKITTLLMEETTQTALINLVSNHLEPAKYAINLQVIANCLQRISKAPVAYDPMLTTLSAEATKGQVFIYKLANDPEHILHQALWPKVNFEELTKEAPTQYQYMPNQGNGAFSSHTIIAAGELDKLDPKLLTPIKAELYNIQLQTQYNSHLELLRNELKAGYAGIYGLFCVLVSAVDEASKKRRELETATKAATEKQTTYNQAQAKVEETTNRAKQAEQAYNESLAEQQRIGQKQLQLEERITVNKKQLEALGLNERALLEIIPTSFKGEAFLPFIKQIRMLPVFNDIRYILPNQVYENLFALGVYSKGNLDVLEKVLTEFYGARAKGQATLWDKFSELASRAKAQVHNLAVDAKDWVLGMKISEIKNRRRLVAVFAKRLEEVLQQLIEAVDINKLKAANAQRILSDKKVINALIKLLGENNALAATAKENLEQALATMNAKQIELNEVPNYKPAAEKYQAALKSPMLPGALMILEAWNVFSVYKDYDNVVIKRGGNRADWGMRSAGLDGGLAFLLFIERLEIQKLQILTKTFEHITWVRNIGLGQTNLLGVINCAAMALTAGICFWDAVYYYKRNNPAWIGYAMAGTGASMLALQALLPALITPVGWFVVGVGLLVIGLLLATYLDNSDKIKEWFLQGPYRDNSNERYNHLQDTTKALYHIISLLLYFTVDTNKINRQETQAKWQQLAKPPLTETEAQKELREAQLTHYNKARQADLQVSIKCLCANFLSGCQFIPALAKYEQQSTTSEGVTSHTLMLKETIPLEQLKDNIHVSDTGIDLYLKLNPTQVNQGIGYSIKTKDVWVFKVQVIAQPLEKAFGEKTRVFPAPPLEYASDYDSNTDSVPFFKKQEIFIYNNEVAAEQNFWFETVIDGAS